MSTLLYTVSRTQIDAKRHDPNNFCHYVKGDRVKRQERKRKCGKTYFRSIFYIDTLVVFAEG